MKNTPRCLNPLAREQVEILPRPKLSPLVRDRVLAKHNGQCSHIACEATDGLQIDHIIARGLGGPDAEHNYAPLCVPHHKIKTARDAKLIAKAKRLLAREDGTRRPRQKIQGRGFDKTKTRSFKGEVRPRTTKGATR